jgi:hypothetical protein
MEDTPPDYGWSLVGGELAAVAGTTSNTKPTSSLHISEIPFENNDKLQGTAPSSRARINGRCCRPTNISSPSLKSGLLT